MRTTGSPHSQGLYDPAHEHDACGVGFVADLKGTKTHAIIEKAFEVLLNLEHRGACGCEKNTGDGAGILLQTPHRFLRKVCAEEGIDLPEYGDYGVGMVFLPVDPDSRRQCEEAFEDIVREEGQHLLGWRAVPTDNSPIGPTAKAAEPVIKQIFIGRADGFVDDLAFERKLFVIRKRVRKTIKASTIVEGNKFYITSLSYKTLVYKGMLTAPQLMTYYPDLTDPAVESAMAMVHSRFSTNTFPNWARAHPYRYISHNGEINTLRGNVNWTGARESIFESELLARTSRRSCP
jgi:glutamate synthase (ferredoxin)